jgi:prepilin-type N-terminal cleavage/methylation domain-containing protein
LREHQEYGVQKKNFMRNNQSGFTIFELLIAMLLLTMVSVMIYSILNVGIQFSSKGEKKILAIERQYGFLTLLKRQVSSALYSPKEKKLLISADDAIFRVVTRNPFIYRAAGVVLAIYRYDAGSQTVFYTEKRDYYNTDYDEEYVPDFDEMTELARNEDSFSISYDETLGPAVILEYRGKDYVFLPKCLNDELLAKIEQ